MTRKSERAMRLARAWRRDYQAFGGSRIGYVAHYRDSIESGFYTVEDVYAIHDADLAAVEAAERRAGLSPGGGAA